MVGAANDKEENTMKNTITIAVIAMILAFMPVSAYANTEGEEVAPEVTEEVVVDVVDVDDVPSAEEAELETVEEDAEEVLPEETTEEVPIDEPVAYEEEETSDDVVVAEEDEEPVIEEESVEEIDEEVVEEEEEWDLPYDIALYESAFKYIQDNFSDEIDISSFKISVDEMDYFVSYLAEYGFEEIFILDNGKYITAVGLCEDDEDEETEEDEESEEIAGSDDTPSAPNTSEEEELEAEEISEDVVSTEPVTRSVVIREATPSPVAPVKEPAAPAMPIDFGTYALAILAGILLKGGII